MKEIAGGGVGLNGVMKIMGLLSCKKIWWWVLLWYGFGYGGFAMILVFSMGHCIPFVLIACLELCVLEGEGRRGERQRMERESEKNGEDEKNKKEREREE